jgi:type IV pilus assembly protein PilO
MKINGKEKILLLVLVLVIGAYLFYNFVYIKNEERLVSLEQEMNEKAATANELLNAVEREKELKFEFKSLNFEISDMSIPYLPQIDQEKVIVFFNKYFDNYDIDVNSINFSDVNLTTVEYTNFSNQENNTEYPLHNLKNQYFETEEDVALAEESFSATAENMQLTFDFETNYYDLMDFIDALQTNQINFVISNSNITSSDEIASTMTGTMQVSLYSIPKLHDHENLEWAWNDIIEFGRANPFYLDGVVLNPYWTTRYDLDMAVGPIQSDSPTVSIGLFNDTTYNSYVYADNNTVENIEIQFKQEGDKYFYKYKTLLGSYPDNYQFWIEFEPSNEFISMNVTSTARTSEEDQSGANISIINNTDKLFYINVYSDDLVRPRIIVETTENVIIKND